VFEILKNMVVETLQAKLVEKEARNIALYRDNERMRSRTWEIQRLSEKIAVEAEYQMDKPDEGESKIGVERMNLDNMRNWAKEICSLCSGRM